MHVNTFIGLSIEKYYLKKKDGLWKYFSLYLLFSARHIKENAYCTAINLLGYFVI